MGFVFGSTATRNIYGDGRFTLGNFAASLIGGVILAAGLAGIASLPSRKKRV